MPNVKMVHLHETRSPMIKILSFLQQVLQMPISLALRKIPSPRIVTAEVILDNQVIYSSQQNF